MKRLILLLLICWVRYSAQDISLCSSENTGASGDSVYNQYQSNGSCEETCEEYAYAILLENYCWCSNYAPSTTESTDSCSDDCPGYPTDNCGNSAENYYAYILIGNPSGTLTATSDGTSETASSTTKTSSSSSSTTTSTSATSTDASPSATSSSSPTTTTDSTSTDSAGSSSITDSITSADSASSSTSSTSSVEPSVIIKTVSGDSPTTITTIIASPTSSSSSADKDSNKSSKSSFFDSPGKVAGVFVVVGLVVLACIAALLWFCFFRNRRSNAEGAGAAGGKARDESDASSNENELEKMFNSQQVMVDQRLDPNSMMFMNLNNSKKSLGDDIDYSRRVLRVVNE